MPNSSTRNWPNGSTRAYRKARAARLAQAGGMCELGLPGCTKIATQVHHTRPRRLVGDAIEYLRATCRSCNHAAGEPREDGSSPHTFHAVDPEPVIHAWWEDRDT